jgi:tRNA threonylcarbamoyl adenosine modification protein YeaZ
MRTLVIDTATRACSVALFDGDNCVAASHEVIGRGHAEKLLPFIADLPDKGRAEQIMVNVGPGSFTGIRVGVSAAKALAFAWQIEAYGYNCLALIAAMAASKSGYPVDVAMAGGHGECFFQSFDDHGIAAEIPLSLSPIVAAKSLQAGVVAGDAAIEIGKIVPEIQAVDMLPDAQYWPLIADNAKLPPRPFYGRAPDAIPAKVGVS